MANRRTGRNRARSAGLTCLLLASAGGYAHAVERSDSIAPGARAIEQAPTPLCGLPSTAALTAVAKETPEGHRDYQDWLADPRVQAELPRLEEALAVFPDAALPPAIDHVNRRIIVAVDPAEIDRGAVRRHLEARGLTLPLRIQPACRSIASTREVERILLEQRWHPAAASASYTAHFDPAIGKHLVVFDPGVRTPTGAVQAEIREMAEALRDRLGDRVAIEYAPAGRASRLNDGEPHYGAAGIGRSMNDNQCTSGFVIERGGMRGAVTAGHCFVAGDAVYSGSHRYGTIAVRAAFPTVDMARIAPGDQTFARRIHTTPGSPTNRVQTGWNNPAIGSLVCFSGMVSEAICGVEVTTHTGLACGVSVDGISGCTNNLDVGNKDVLPLGRLGDSGAPVYTRVGGSGAEINGMVVGVGGYNIFFHRVSDIILLLEVDVADE